MLLSILIIFSGAFLAAIIDKILKRWSGIILALFPFSVFIYFFSLRERVISGEIIQSNLSCVKVLNINISFYFDGLFLLFALLVL